MNRFSTFIIIAAALTVPAARGWAQLGTPFVPGNTGGTGAQNPNGSFVHPSGLAQDGNPNLFVVSGAIAEFIEFTAVDNQLELGDLGNPKNVGWVASVDPATNTGALAGETAASKGTPDHVAQTTGNGTAIVELDSNSYVTIEANYGGDLTNAGPTSSPSDDYTLPTRYRVAARGREFRFGNTALQGSPAGYTSYQSAVGSGNSSKVTFSPGSASGLRIMSEVQRNGLNNYRGQYQTTIAVNYFKF